MTITLRAGRNTEGDMMSLEDSRRRLMWHGMLLFLLGLLTGLLEAQFANPRMGWPRTWKGS